MSNLGEWDDDPEPGDADHPPVQAAAALDGAVAAALRSLDLGAAVEAAAHKAVQRRIDKIAVEAVTTIVDQDTDALARLRTQAEQSVTAALTARAQPTTADDGGDGEKSEAPTLFYKTVDAFVTHQLAPMYRRELSGNNRAWCPKWWRHGEALSRLDALWRAWEYLRLDPATGSSVWFKDHLDHHMSVLLDPDGPFKKCRNQQHSNKLEPLPIDEPPKKMFTEDEPPDQTRSTHGLGQV